MADHLDLHRHPGRTAAGACAACAAGLGAGALLGVLWARGRTSGNTPPASRSPGSAKTARTRALEAGARVLQAKTPLDAMNLYLDGFHFASGDMAHQMEAHHYCTQLDDELIQCVIYDGNTRSARLIGVEYIISERLFATLPEDEKPLWHSHHHEVLGGTLAAPGLPDLAEHALMRDLASTYGKTWHTWDSAHHALPLGIPKLMMGFTSEDQIDREMVARRDRRMGVNTGRNKRRRGDIPMPEVLPGANAWEAAGHAPQLELAVQRMRGYPG